MARMSFFKREPPSFGPVATVPRATAKRFLIAADRLRRIALILATLAVVGPLRFRSYRKIFETSGCPCRHAAHDLTDGHRRRIPWPSSNCQRFVWKSVCPKGV